MRLEQPEVAPIPGLWYTQPESLPALLVDSPTLAGEFFDRKDSYQWDGNIPDGWVTTPYVNYGSYAAFAADLQDGDPPDVSMLMYNPEKWGRGTRVPELQRGATDPERARTPNDEQLHPAKYMPLFATLAHANDYQVIVAPGMSLMTVPGADCTQRDGEGLFRAYLRCKIPWYAAEYADQIDVQAQRWECQASTYASYVSQAATQARNANDSVLVLSGLSTGQCGPTGEDLFAAWRAVRSLTAGHFLWCGPPDTDMAVDFLGEVAPVIVGDPNVQPDFSPPDEVLVQGATAWWRVSWNADRTHSISDRSGLGLFDTGLQKAGYTFHHRYPGAGVYTLTDIAEGATGTISLPVQATPPSGDMSTVFTIQTAVEAAPTGYYFHTQIERPGQTWKSWKTGWRNTFTPDAGLGIYSFRAHLVRKSNGASAGWSPVASITVT